MSEGTLFDKVWDEHKVAELPGGKDQLFVGMHLIHEVTSPQAFDMLKEQGLKVRRPDLAVAVEDHVIPTDNREHPYVDENCELMSKTLKQNCKETGIRYFEPGSGEHGVCHVLFPEVGAIWPGRLTVMGDSHTSTHGALGALAFGIGTTQVSHVLATQTVAMPKPRVVAVDFIGTPERGTTAKDYALAMIRQLGVDGGKGCAYILRGSPVEHLNAEERMTLCNMGIEGGAKSVIVQPDDMTFGYLEGRPMMPKNFLKAIDYWRSLRSDNDAKYDDYRTVDLEGLVPMVTWGINPEQVIGVNEKIPDFNEFNEKKRRNAEDAAAYMGGFGEQMLGVPVDRAFIGSCTNGRITDMEAVAEIVKGKKVKIPTLLSYGSEKVMQDSIDKGYDEIFRNAGIDVRLPGCSMCLAMNPDKLVGSERCISTSNRNFRGRQGSKTGRTHLASPYTVAASAIEGQIADPRRYL